MVVTKFSRLKRFFCSQYTAGFAMMMASASTGTFTGWATAILPIFQSPDWPIRMDQSQIAWVLSIHFLGNILGAIPAGIFMDKFGRKRTLLFSGLMLPLTSWLLVFISTGGTLYHPESDTVSTPGSMYHPESDTVSTPGSMYHPKSDTVSTPGSLHPNVSTTPGSLHLKASTTPGSWYLLLVARLICGIWNGVVTTISPIYLAEIAEPTCRGRLNTLVALFFRLGNLLAILASLVFSYNILPIILSISTVFFLLVFPFLPETPYYLVKKGEYTKAGKSLMWLRYTKLQQTGVEELEMELKTKIIGGQSKEWNSKETTKLESRLETKLEIETNQETELDTKLDFKLVEESRKNLYSEFETEQGIELEKIRETELNAKLKMELPSRLRTRENIQLENDVDIESNRDELQTELETKLKIEGINNHKMELQTNMETEPKKEQNIEQDSKNKLQTGMKSKLVGKTEKGLLQTGVETQLDTGQQKLEHKAQINKELLQNELSDIREAVTKQMQLQKTTFAQKFKSTTTLKSLFIVETLSILLRMAGIAPIINYVAGSLPGSDHFNSNFSVLSIEVTRLISGLISSMFIDRLQRRELLIGSSMVCGCSMTLMAGFYWFDDFDVHKHMMEKNYFENMTEFESSNNNYFENSINFESASNSYLENMTDFKKESTGNFNYFQNSTNFESGSNSFLENFETGRSNNYSNNVTNPESGDRPTSIAQNSPSNTRIDFNNRPTVLNISNNVRPSVHQIVLDYISNISKTHIIRPSEKNFWDEMNGLKNVNQTRINTANKANHKEDKMYNSIVFTTTENVSNISENIRPSESSYGNAKYDTRSILNKNKAIRNNSNFVHQGIGSTNISNDVYQIIDRINNHSEVFTTGNNRSKLSKNKVCTTENCSTNLQKIISNFFRWLPLTCIIIHGISYSFGVAAVCSNIRSELFPMNVKGECSAITSIVTALTSFALSRSFPITRNYFGLCFNFAIYAASSFSIALFARFHVPETSGKTLQEIQNELEMKSSDKV